MKKSKMIFWVPILNEKSQETYFLTCIAVIQNTLQLKFFEKANGTNVDKFLPEYVYNLVVPPTIRLDQATCLVGKTFTNYCNEINIDILDAPVGDHRAIGLVERMIQTIKRPLSCMQVEHKDKFSTSSSMKSIVSDLRLTKQKTTKITPFEAHFCCSANTPLKIIILLLLLQV